MAYSWRERLVLIDGQTQSTAQTPYSRRTGQYGSSRILRPTVCTFGGARSILSMGRESAKSQQKRGVREGWHRPSPSLSPGSRFVLSRRSLPDIGQKTYILSDQDTDETADPS